MHWGRARGEGGGGVKCHACTVTSHAISFLACTLLTEWQPLYPPRTVYQALAGLQRHNYIEGSRGLSFALHILLDIRRNMHILFCVKSRKILHVLHWIIILELLWTIIVPHMEVSTVSHVNNVPCTEKSLQSCAWGRQFNAKYHTSSGECTQESWPALGLRL